MRVVLIPHRFPAASETFIASVFERLLERGWDAHVVCAESLDPDWALFPHLTGARDRVHLSWPRRPRWLAALLIPIVTVWTFLRAPTRTLRYIVRGWKIFGPKVFWRLYVDAQLVILGPDIVHFQFGVFAIARERVGDLLGCASVVSFQGADLNYAGLEKEPGYYAEVWRHADAIHFLGEDLKRRALDRGYVADGRDMVIKPGVDASEFSPAEREPTEGRPLRILSVGRLHWKKGYEYALDAVRRLRLSGVEVEYRVIGDGEFREGVVQAIHDFGLESVVSLLGSVPLESVRSEMQRADVLLHAAVSEGFCYVAVEAQAMQLPVVTSDADGLGENVEDSSSGFVVARRDGRALADRLAELATDDGLRIRMGEAGRRRALEVFAPTRQIEGFEDLYERAIARRRVRAEQAL